MKQLLLAMTILVTMNAAAQQKQADQKKAETISKKIMKKFPGKSSPKIVVTRFQPAQKKLHKD